MGVLTLIIIFIGFLTTGATRQHVYRTWRNRIRGRLYCNYVSLLIYYKIIILSSFVSHLENLVVISLYIF